jgi:Regulator of chromosome condensation (RCC1) repeat
MRAPRLFSPRPRALIARMTLVLAPAVGVAALGCSEYPQSPSESPSAAPDHDPALATATSALSFRQISGGESHTCGVATDNRAYCWGQNSAGALGNGKTMTISLKPALVSGGLRFLQISAGSEYTCGITTDYKAYCWGENFRSQLGDGTTTDRLTPVAVIGNYRFRDVRAGFLHTCAVTTDNKAFCWGDNSYNQLGDTTSGVGRRQRPFPVVGGLSFQQVVAGGLHTCGLTTDHRAYCWGDGRTGQIGDGTTSRRRTPTLVAGGFLWSQVAPGERHSAGGSHSCGVTTNGRAYCWGRERQGAARRRHDHPAPEAGRGCRRSDIQRPEPKLRAHLRADDRRPRLLLGLEVLRGARRWQPARRRVAAEAYADRGCRWALVQQAEYRRHPHLWGDHRKRGLLLGSEQRRTAGRRHPDQQLEASSGERGELIGSRRSQVSGRTSPVRAEIRPET